MTELHYIRGAVEHVGPYANDFFEEMGLGRPINLDYTNGHVSALVSPDGVIHGAAYAAAATAVTDALLWSGWGPNAYAYGNRFHALLALAVKPESRGQGHGSNLLASISEHSKRDYGARFLLTRLEKSDTDLHGWLGERSFNVCAPGQQLVLDDIPIPLSPDSHVDAWRSLRAPAGWVTQPQLI